MTNITYVFSGNRKNRYLDENYEAREFFYGLHNFTSEEYNLEIIEPSNNKFIFKRLTLLIDDFFKKVINLPVYMSDFVTIKNLKILLKTDKLILVNETTFCSLAPALLIIGIFKKIDIYVFVMGLYSKKLRFSRLKFLHFFFIRVFNKTVKKLMFLGDGELSRAKSIHPKNIDKFQLFPFSVDTDFWTHQKNSKTLKNGYILFVGNDSNRDPETFLKIVKELDYLEFKAVTNISSILNANFKNLIVHEGSFGSSNLSDSELRDIYSNAKLVILPLKNSSQPSGQSVTLQAMSCSKPVMITKTVGFWDEKEFINNREILFVDNNQTTDWVQNIKTIYDNEEFLRKIEKNGLELVRNNYNLDIFKIELLKTLELVDS
jgi:glycosyltransferase involved in cell wall biosynthesis